MEDIERPKVGLGVLIFKDKKVLLGKRKNAHGAGEYAFPGGHLEFMESFEDCARREVREETGIEIENIRFQYLGNITSYGNKHYVQIMLMADWKEGDAKVLEPEKCEAWEWFDLESLPEPMFESCKLSFESLKTGKNYFDLRSS